jgi:uncharacterized repeat protein (TIGR03837 family)
MQWDIFCRVIDNFGDIGVCWRLARDLAARGQAARLWLDDPSALVWMAPGGAAGVEVVRWHDHTSLPLPGDVVVEAFGCDPPAAFVAHMAARPVPPVWINLEYLSAEGYVAGNHGLPSPQLSGTGKGLTKWFYYPGFDAASGGLIREPGLLAARQAFDATRWLHAHGIVPARGEYIVSLFSYAHAPLPALLATLASRPTLLLIAPGPAQRAIASLQLPATVRHIELPWLELDEYDRLLWACDLNFVRGEDSFVRAMWAGAPFVWQIYPQHDGAHAAKLDAFVARFTAAADAPLAARLRALHQCWNALDDGALELPDNAAWQVLCVHWRDRLLAGPDLGSSLLQFVGQKR